jgi:hypothetical protein
VQRILNNRHRETASTKIKYIVLLKIASSKFNNKNFVLITTIYFSICRDMPTKFIRLLYSETSVLQFGNVHKIYYERAALNYQN